MTGPLRVGVIGANPNRSWAKDSHIPALRSLENVQLAAVATTSRASADAAAAAFGVVHVAIGLQAHMNPAARRAAELIAAGAIGRPLTARIFSSTAGFAPRLPATHAYLNTIESGANLITILSGHTLDLAILVLGGIDSLNALTTLQHPTVTLTDTGEQIQRTAPDHLLLQARMISGCALAVEVAGNRAPDTAFTFEVVGTDGGLLLTGGHPYGFQAGRLTVSLNGERQWVDEPPDTLPGAAVNVAAMYCALARDISSGEHTTPDFDHAVRLTHLIDDVVQSADTGHRVTRQDWPTKDPSYR
jgi:predicted dehydrogenase